MNTNPFKANIIIEDTRKELKEFIVYEVKNLYSAFGWENPNFAEEEDWVIDSQDLDKRFRLGISVDNSYLDVEDCIVEFHYLDAIKVVVDDDLYVALEDVDGEIHWEELTTDELVTIANALELTYRNKIMAR